MIRAAKGLSQRTTSLNHFRRFSTVPRTLVIEEKAGIDRFWNLVDEQLNVGYSKVRYSDSVYREVDLAASVSTLSRMTIDDNAMEKANAAFVLQDIKALGNVRFLLGKTEDDFLDFLMKIQQPNCASDHFDYLSSENFTKHMRYKLHQIFRTHLGDNVQFSIDLRRKVVVLNKKPSISDATKAYLQFTLFAQNIGTKRAIRNIASLIDSSEDDFYYQTENQLSKVTSVQVCSVANKTISDFKAVNDTFLIKKTDREDYNDAGFIRTGDFQYIDNPADMTLVYGKQHEILLRDVSFRGKPKKLFESIADRGFVNYFPLLSVYGAQSRHRAEIASVQHIGRAIYQSDFRAATEMLFAPLSCDSESLSAVKRLFSVGNYTEALATHKECLGSSTEDAIYGHILTYLAKIPAATASTAAVLEEQHCAAAFAQVPKELKHKYTHAYRTFVWNKAAGRRINLAINTSDATSSSTASNAAPAPALQGDIVVLDESILLPGVDSPGGVFGENDINSDGSDDFVTPRAIREGKLHIVTAEDEEQNRFSIHDVVLPVLGCDVIFPDNAVGQYYLDTLRYGGEAELDIGAIRIDAEAEENYPIYGGYRRVVQRPLDFSYELLTTEDINAQLQFTEGDAIHNTLQQQRDGKLQSEENVDVSHMPILNDLARPIDIRSAAEIARRGPSGESEVDKFIRGAEFETPEFICAKLKFTLPVQSDVSMLLRELTKEVPLEDFSHCVDVPRYNHNIAAEGMGRSTEFMNARRRTFTIEKEIMLQHHELIDAYFDLKRRYKDMEIQERRRQLKEAALEFAILRNEREASGYFDYKTGESIEGPVVQPKKMKYRHDGLGLGFKRSNVLRQSGLVRAREENDSTATTASSSAAAATNTDGNNSNSSIDSSNNSSSDNDSSAPPVYEVTYNTDGTLTYHNPTGSSSSGSDNNQHQQHQQQISSSGSSDLNSSRWAQRSTNRIRVVPASSIPARNSNSLNSTKASPGSVDWDVKAFNSEVIERNRRKKEQFEAQQRQTASAGVTGGLSQ